MRKAYVMQSFDGFSDPRLDLIMDNNGKVVNDRDDALLIAESFSEMFSTKVTDILVFEIEAKDVSIYDALEYTEDQVVGLFRNSTRIMHGKLVNIGRMAVDAGNIAVCGNPGFSFEVMGIGETTEKALREAWNIMYKEEYTGSEEQLDRLNSDCAISTATISQAAEDIVRDGYHDLDECEDLIFHQTYKDRYEICTRKEYIHMLMTGSEDNTFHWD